MMSIRETDPNFNKFLHQFDLAMDGILSPTDSREAAINLKLAVAQEIRPEIPHLVS